jgi:hypothetical protein
MKSNKVVVHGLVVFLRSKRPDWKREVAVKLTIPKSDLPTIKSDTMSAVLDKHTDYIMEEAASVAKTNWPTDWFNYDEVEFGVCDIREA